MQEFGELVDGHTCKFRRLSEWLKKPKAEELRMIRERIDLLLLSLFVPARHSSAAGVSTTTETYSSSSQMASPPVDEYGCTFEESRQSTFPGVEERRSIQTCSEPDMDSSVTGGDYQYKREHTESHVRAFPGTEEQRTELETYSSRDADITPPVVVQHDQVAPPVVVEHDRTIVERDVPPPPREGRLQAWWHRNFHRDTD
jgi:hypothetical protein